MKTKLLLVLVALCPAVLMRQLLKVRSWPPPPGHNRAVGKWARLRAIRRTSNGV